MGGENPFSIFQEVSMSNVPKSEQPESHYEVVDNAYKIYNKVLDICMRMPKRYTDLVLKDIVHDAHRMASECKEGNSGVPKFHNDFLIRREHFLRAYGKVEALSSDMDFFLFRPQVLSYFDQAEHKTVGVSKGDLKDISAMLRKEKALIAGTLEKELERFVDLPN